MKNRHRPNDSSRVRVAPFFDALLSSRSNWLGELLDLAAANGIGPLAATHPWRTRDLTITESFWSSEHRSATDVHKASERPLAPPHGLLTELVQRLVTPKNGMPRSSAATAAKRERLIACDPVVIREALDALERHRARMRYPRAWYVLEGNSYPDVFIETPDALIVIEGKFTERGATTKTRWMPDRPQMLRHLDAAWELRGTRAIYGLFIVDSETNLNDVAWNPAQVPETWRTALAHTINSDALRKNFPHRSDVERQQIAGSLVGVTTWQAMQQRFHLDPDVVYGAETIYRGDGSDPPATLPAMRVVAVGEGASVAVGQTASDYYLMTDESAMADFLEPGDPTVTVRRFARRADRDSYFVARYRGLRRTN